MRLRRICSPGFLPASHRSLLAVALAIVAVTPAIFPSQEQQKSGSAPIQLLSVTGSAKFHSEQIVPVTGLRVGQVVTRQDIQDAANALAALGLFSSVRYNFFTATSGVQIHYEVSDAPTVSAFFDNFPWFTDAELTAFVKTSVPLFDGTAPKRGKILDDIAEALERELETRTITANVSHDLITLPWNEEQVMMFRAEGEAMPSVQSVQFTDALASSDRAIADRIGDLVGKPYSRMAVGTFEFEQVRPVYLAHAFLNVKFGDSTVRLNGNKVVVQAPIDPGPAFTWSGVTWEGNQAIPVAQLDALVNLVPGGSANGIEIEGAWEKVQTAFENLGYLDVAVDAVPHFDQANKRVSYDVKINGGPQYHMGKLVLSGVSLDGEQRLREAWKIAPGAVFNDSIYQEFLDSGIKHAFAGLPFHYQTIQKYLDKHPGQGTINVMLNFE
jgi:outer membrane protein assembly factor BamA